MITKSGIADLPLHPGKVPEWLYQRMADMARAITEAIVLDYGNEELIRRISDPYWFQALGSVMGMDWHSSGITTTVIGALKRAINPISREIGLKVCGGRGGHSRKTPSELLDYAETTGLNGSELVRSSRLCAKVDNTAIQDGFQIYLHAFLLTHTGKWAVIQQGMNGPSGMARRYHWHSGSVRSFVEEPHTGVIGANQGSILNLTDTGARNTREGILGVTRERPDRMIDEIRIMVMPRHHDITYRDVDLKRLGAVLTAAYDRRFTDFEDLLLVEGLGPKTLRSLTLISEVIHGTPSRFRDPARFAFANGGKDGIPFPVQTRVYDDSLQYMRSAIERAKIGIYDKQRAVKKLQILTAKLEPNFIPDMSKLKPYLNQEIEESKFHGGRTAAEPGTKKKRVIRTVPDGAQLSLFS